MKLTGPLKRDLAVAGQLYTLTITPDGFELVPKGGRKGYELKWSSFVASLLDARAIDRRPEKTVQPARRHRR